MVAEGDVRADGEGVRQLYTAAGGGLHILARRLPLRTPKPRLNPSPERLRAKQSLALLLLAGEDHALAALQYAGAHDICELTGRLAYDGFLSQQVVTEGHSTVWADRTIQCRPRP
jgi:hypothetical protein